MKTEIKKWSVFALIGFVAAITFLSPEVKGQTISDVFSKSKRQIEILKDSIGILQTIYSNKLEEVKSPIVGDLGWIGRTEASNQQLTNAVKQIEKKVKSIDSNHPLRAALDSAIVTTKKEAKELSDSLQICRNIKKEIDNLLSEPLGQLKREIASFEQHLLRLNYPKIKSQQELASLKKEFDEYLRLMLTSQKKLIEYNKQLTQKQNLEKKLSDTAKRVLSEIQMVEQIEK